MAGTILTGCILKLNRENLLLSWHSHSSGNQVSSTDLCACYSVRQYLGWLKSLVCDSFLTWDCCSMFYFGPIPVHSEMEAKV